MKLKYACMFSVSTNSLFGHVLTIQCACTYVYVHVHNVMSVDARAFCKYIFRWLPMSKCFSIKHALCAPYAHFSMKSVQMELWTTTLQSHFNIDRYQVCAHECTFNPFPTVSVKLTDSVVFTHIFMRVLEYLCVMWIYFIFVYIITFLKVQALMPYYFNPIVQGYNRFNVARMYDEICKKDEKNKKCATSINVP